MSGYTGGTTVNPTYEQVSREGTGHFEAVKVTYDPAVVSYAQLLDVFWKNVDPFDPIGQFCDKGDSYRSAIFVSGQTERDVAQAALEGAAETLGQDVVTEVLPAATFWPAEDDHQDYYIRSAVKYGYYRKACGRDARLQELWGKAPKGS